MTKRDTEEMEVFSFYGDNTLESLKETLQRAKIRKLETKHLEIWEIFFKLDNALEYLENHPNNQQLALFSFENQATLCKMLKVYSKQQRFFLVTSLERFWDEYLQLPDEIRHFYEVIPYNQPCNLYFDLEFSKVFNPQVNGDELVESLIDLLSDFIYSDNIHLESKDILDLDSSTDQKFSRHLIIHMKTFQGKKVAFQDFSHAKNFINRFVEQLPDEFRLKKDDEHFACFVDEAVYSKNRSFRIYLSTKKGKTSYLVPSKKNQYPYETSQDLFHSSLVVSSKHDQVFLVEQPPKSQEYTYTTSQEMRIPTSHFPEITNFIRTLITDGRDARSGSISKIEHLPSSNRLVYSIKNYRYCENIQRPHKSNSIYYIVDLNKSIYYQKCFDPDCKDFRSNDFAIQKK